jgi:uncharacterized membrane protein
MSIEELLLLIVAVVLVTFIFYVSGAIVSQDWTMTSPYLMRILVVAVLVVFVIPVFRDAASELNLRELGVLLAFVLLIIAVRFIVIEELTVSDDWLAAIIVSFLAVVLFYVIEAVAKLFDIALVALF